MRTHTSHTRTTLVRLAGAALVAGPLTLAGLGQAHAAPVAKSHSKVSPALTQLVTAQQGIGGFARTPGSVAVSGNTAVVGSIGDNAAYVFVKTATGWAQQARLGAADANPNDQFGYAVAINGNTILVGDPAHTGADCNGTPGQQTGLVYEFDRTGTTWSQTTTIGCSFAGDKLGAALAFDGTDAVLGAPGNQQNTGLAYLFHEITPGDWQLQQTLRPGDGQPGYQFGSAVAIRGATALVGAPAVTVVTKQADNAIVNTAAGVAYTFVNTGQPVKSGNAWMEQQRIQAPLPTSGASFGSAVAINANAILIGAPFDKNGIGNGKAYLFTHSATLGWTSIATLQASNAASLDQFGTSVALGQTNAVIGAYNADAGYVFSQNGTTWTQTAKLTQAGALGLGSAIATDGTTAVLAAIYGNNYTGAAYAAQIGAKAPSPVAIAATVNDDDPSIVYTGTGWIHFAGRPASFNDFDNDVHATYTQGDSLSFTFSGTGIAYISEISNGYGTFQVYLDGTLKKTLSASSPTASNLGGQTLFQATGLASGRHTIKLVNVSNAYLLLDAFQVR